MELSEIRSLLKNELEEQRNIGLELGFSIGKSEGAKEGYRAALCDLLFSGKLTEKEIKDIFSIDDDEINCIKEIISNPRWIVNHIT